MYTRSYPPRGTPLPENYSGVALRDEIEEDLIPPQNTYENRDYLQEAASVSVDMNEPVCSETAAAEEESPQSRESASLHTPPEEGEAWQRDEESPIAHEKAEKTHEAHRENDLLLIALAALLTEGERRDDDLLIILLLLLLS